VRVLSNLNVHRRGVRGHGTAISLVDDGLEWRHKDFGEGSRFLAEGSKDWNGRDDDPSPVRSDDTHGTGTTPSAV
jgi:hypothetical protein